MGGSSLTSVRPYKFLVIPVIQAVDDNGNVVQEITPEQPVSIFGIDGLHKFADNFEAEVVAQNSRVVMPTDGQVKAVSDRQ